MIKKIIITMFILNLLFLTAGCSGNLSNNAAIIDGQDITIEEFSFAANVCKSETILYFSNKYNVSDVSSNDFWNGTFGENKEKPIDVLKENALDFLKYSHTIFYLAKEQGIIGDCSFETIKEMYNEENEHRKGDDIVYGVTGFDFSSYYDWLLSNFELQLENIEEGSISQGDIENYYELNKDRIALKPVEYICNQYKLEYSKHVFERIQGLLDNNSGFEEIGYEFDVRSDETSYDMSNEKAISVMTPNLLSALKGSEVGDIISVVDSNVIYVLEVYNKSEPQYEQISAVSSKIKTIIAKEKIDKIIEKKIADIEVQKTEWLIESSWQDFIEMD